MALSESGLPSQQESHGQFLPDVTDTGSDLQKWPIAFFNVSQLL
jgi:hypothetical protein